MAAYPSNLPAPQVSEYSVSTIRGVSAVTFEHGNKRQRRAAKRERQYFTLTFVFSMAELWTWQSWADDFGYDWHTMNLESPWSGLVVASSTLITHTVRYISDVQIEPIGSGYVRVSVQAEMDVNTVPQGAVVYTGNWYVARTPSNPAPTWIISLGASSPDTIIAGTPSLPAA